MMIFDVMLYTLIGLVDIVAFIFGGVILYYEYKEIKDGTED